MKEKKPKKGDKKEKPLNIPVSFDQFIKVAVKDAPKKKGYKS